MSPFSPAVYFFASFFMLRFTTAAIFLCTALASQAQPSSGGPTPVTGVPIDGGISVLVAGGAAYALRRLRQRRRNIG